MVLVAFIADVSSANSADIFRVSRVSNPDAKAMLLYSTCF